MEEKRTVFGYLAEVFMIFGITILILNMLCLLFGPTEQDISSMFRLGNKGLSVWTVLQFFLVSIGITFLRFLFFTDQIIKKMSVVWRTVFMVLSILVLITGFILCCDWFPADMWEAWAMFLLCFAISFAVSTGIMVLKERAENRQMEEALKRLQEEGKDGLRS